MHFSFTIQNQLKDVDLLHNELQKVQTRWALAKKCTCELNLVLDEIVTNIIQHGDPSPRTIEISLEKRQNELTIKVVDDGPQFDPTGCSLPDTNIPLEERTCGGLGILLVRRFSNCLDYKRDGNTNILTLTKRLPDECLGVAGQ